jgi:hypothetical protein
MTQSMNPAFAHVPLVAVMALAAALACAASRAGEPAPAADVDLHDLAAVRARGGIPRGVFETLEAFRPPTVAAEEGRLRRIELGMAVSVDGRPSASGKVTLELIPGTPGYVLRTTETTAAAATARTEVLSWRNLVQLLLRSRSRIANKSPGAPDVDLAQVATLTGLVLPDKAEVALAPGASWSFETTTDSATGTNNAASGSSPRSRAPARTTCTNAQREPASRLAPGLAGTMFKAACGDLVFQYLEAYGVFVPVEARVRLPGDRFLASTYAVERVELATREAAAANDRRE